MAKYCQKNLAIFLVLYFIKESKFLFEKKRLFLSNKYESKILFYSFITFIYYVSISIFELFHHYDYFVIIIIDVNDDVILD